MSFSKTCQELVGIVDYTHCAIYNMAMNEKRLHTALEEFTLPAWREIPDVGLYLDQVVKYINGFLSGFPEMQITGSMVSNYVKHKIIPSPVRKTYSREQLASLIFIAMAKTVLSMDHIRICLKGKDIFADAENTYDAFAENMMRSVHRFSKNDEEIAFMSHDTLYDIVIAVAHKMYLERYFDEITQNEAD